MLSRFSRVQRGLAFASFAAFFVILAFGVPLQAQTPQRPRKTENVLLITFDGLRWQELFYGADPRLMNKEQGGVDAEELRARMVDRHRQQVAAHRAADLEHAAALGRGGGEAEQRGHRLQALGTALAERAAQVGNRVVA